MASIKLHHPTSPLKATGRRPTGQSPHKRGQRLSLQWAASPAVALTSRGQRDRETERDTGTERRHFKDSQQGHLKQMDREEWKGGVGWSTGTGGVTWRPWCTHEVWVSCIRWEQWCQMSTFMPAQWHLIQRQTDRHNKKIYTHWSDKTHTHAHVHTYTTVFIKQTSIKIRGRIFHLPQGPCCLMRMVVWVRHSARRLSQSLGYVWPSLPQTGV